MKILKNCVLYIAFFLVLCFLNYNSVEADCSYQERKDLLKAVTNVDISLETVKNDDGSYSFKYNIVGLTDEIFFKYYNTSSSDSRFVFYSDSDNGYFSFTDDVSDVIYTYIFTFYSTNDNCAGSEIKKIKLKKPMYNVYSENINCTFINNKDFKYCKKFVDVDYKLDDERFYKELEKYNSGIIEEETEENNTDIDYKIPIIITIILIILIVGIFLFIKFRKRL